MFDSREENEKETFKSFIKIKRSSSSGWVPIVIVLIILAIGLLVYISSKLDKTPVVEGAKNAIKNAAKNATKNATKL